MFQAPAFGVELESASFPCDSCLMCLPCLVTPVPDADVMSVQHAWHIIE